MADDSLSIQLALDGVAIPVDTCTKVGEALPDIAGIGVMVSFAGQAMLSLGLTVWVFFLSRHGRLDLSYEEGTEQYRRQRKRLETISDMLMVGNDSQMLLGIAYMITIWTKQDKIGVYHLRLAFDTVSFVGVSGIVAFVWTAFFHTKLSRPAHRLSLRYLTTYVYIIFFFALTVVLITHLLQWDENASVLGLCYDINGSADPGTEQPGTEITYVVVTGFGLLILMLSAGFGTPKLRRFLVLSAFVQYVVHLYFMVAVRQANQALLEGPDREDRWDFGQTTAMLLLGLSIAEVVQRSWDYRQWCKESDIKSLEAGQKLQYDAE